MRKLDLIYSNCSSFLNQLETEIDSYYSTNKSTIESSELKSTKFADFNSKYSGFLSFISDHHRTKKELFEDYSIPQDFLREYRNFLIQFPDFRYSNPDILEFWLKVVTHLKTILDVDTVITDDLDISDFKLIDLEEQVVQNNFVYHEPTDVKKGLLIFDINITSIEDFLQDSIHSAYSDLLFIWLHLLNFPSNSQGTQYAILHAPHNIPLSDLKAILKLQVLLNGKELKSLEKYEEPPAKPVLSTFSLTEKYGQFSNISTVLNEYNNQYFLLDKYLKLYHVIENFMYKHKICVLQKSKNGDPFHIRDFQTIYDRFDTNENACIQEFFQDVFTLDYDGNTVREYLKTEWTNLEVIETNIASLIDPVFINLNLKIKTYTYQKIKSNFDAGIFGTIVYKIRNSIVHNKDSEFHFESTTIPEGAKVLIEKYLIPNLERIVFHLIINKNDLVWYSSKEISLYE